jgi:hypothetical protein
MIYNILAHIHSIVRWLVLVAIIMALINAIVKLNKKSLANCKDCIFNRLTMILAHVQLVLGLVLYFISPKVVFAAASMKDPFYRFFLVEHILMMLIAIVLITFGYIKSDRLPDDDPRKYKRILIYYGIAFLLIMSAIPWPFRNLGGGWF